MGTPLERRSSAEDPTPADVERLKEAHRRLRDAVAEYEERFGRIEALPGVQPPSSDLQEMAKAQRKIEVAEAELWRLREEALGWRKPSGAPSALESIDWFSDEDRVYDAIEVEQI